MEGSGSYIFLNIEHKATFDTGRSIELSICFTQSNVMMIFFSQCVEISNLYDVPDAEAAIPRSCDKHLVCLADLDEVHLHLSSSSHLEIIERETDEQKFYRVSVHSPLPPLPRKAGEQQHNLQILKDLIIFRSVWKKSCLSG